MKVASGTAAMFQGATSPASSPRSGASPAKAPAPPGGPAATSSMSDEALARLRLQVAGVDAATIGQTNLSDGTAVSQALQTAKASPS